MNDVYKNMKMKNLFLETIKITATINSKKLIETCDSYVIMIKIYNKY